MPSIQGRHDGRSAVVEVAVLDAARHERHRRSAAPIQRNVWPFRALIDTGATSTMVGRRVVDRLGLQPVNKRLYAGLGGIVPRNGYLFHIGFYVSRPNYKPDDVSRIQVCQAVINGGELSEEVSFDVLLGMDIISTGDLWMCRDGTFTFSW